MFDERWKGRTCSPEQVLVRTARESANKNNFRFGIVNVGTLKKRDNEVPETLSSPCEHCLL